MTSKGFSLIEVMIVVAVAAILAMVAVPLYQAYIERVRNTASQHLLRQLALAETGTQVTTETASAGTGSFIFISARTDTLKVQELAEFGFRPDPNIGFVVLPPKSGVHGFVCFAVNRARNSLLHVYDEIASTGVRPFDSSLTFSADPPGELPIFVMDGGSPYTIVSTETVKIDAATGLVTSSGP